MESLLPYVSMVTVPHIMVRLERMLDYIIGTSPINRESTIVLRCEVSGDVEVNALK